jgi:CheY-like chemotaxis protein
MSRDSNSSPLNPKSLERLHSLGGTKLVRNVVQIFLTHVPARIETARQSLQSGDLKGVERAVHSVKSSAGNVGAETLGELSGRIEQLAEEQKGESIGGLLLELESAFSQVKACLQNEEKTWSGTQRIAIVEDNPDNRLLLQAMLGGTYELTEYESGSAALEGLKKNKPDLIILDISLPEMDGTEVLRRLRDEPGFRDIPVIALSAHGRSEDRKQFLEAGFNDYVAKPILDEEKLMETIRRLLSSSPMVG